MKPQLRYLSSPVFLLAVTATALLLLACADGSRATTDFDAMRIQMVKSQIEARGIDNPLVLTALNKVKRHLFVPDQYRDRAYGDFPLPIGEGQTISQPYIVALMTQVLEPDSGMRVLEIGTGSGYQAAILAEICGAVYTIEIVESLGKSARKRLSELGYTNINVKIGDGYQGWKEHAPFDAIIVTCSPTHIPGPLQAQLAEGGKMIVPVGERYNQRLMLLTKKEGRIQEKAVIPVRFVPMVGPGGKPY